MLDRHSHSAAPAARPDGGLPRPPFAVLPYLAILAGVGVAALAGAIPREWALALAGSALVAGAAAGTWSGLQRLLLCDRADRYLATGDGEPPSAAVLEQRRACLIGPNDRRNMARSLRRLIESARTPAASMVRVPVDRRAVLAEAAAIERVAARIERPGVVPARAMALVHLLVTDAASPVYADTDKAQGDLHRALLRIELELGA